MLARLNKIHAQSMSKNAVVACPFMHMIMPIRRLAIPRKKIDIMHISTNL